MNKTQEEMIEKAVKNVMRTSYISAGGVRSMMGAAIRNFICLSKKAEEPAPNNAEYLNRRAQVFRDIYEETMRNLKDKEGYVPADKAVDYTLNRVRELHDADLLLRKNPAPDIKEMERRGDKRRVEQFNEAYRRNRGEDIPLPEEACKSAARTPADSKVDFGWGVLSLVPADKIGVIRNKGESVYTVDAEEAYRSGVIARPTGWKEMCSDPADENVAAEPKSETLSIVVTPDRCVGQPTIGESRFRILDLLQYMRGGMKHAELIEHFGVSQSDINVLSKLEDVFTEHISINLDLDPTAAEVAANEKICELEEELENLFQAARARQKRLSEALLDGFDVEVFDHWKQRALKAEEEVEELKNKEK